MIVVLVVAPAPSVSGMSSLSAAVVSEESSCCVVVVHHHRHFRLLYLRLGLVHCLHLGPSHFRLLPPQHCHLRSRFHHFYHLHRFPLPHLPLVLLLHLALHFSPPETQAASLFLGVVARGHPHSPGPAAVAQNAAGPFSGRLSYALLQLVISVYPLPCFQELRGP